MHLYGSVSSNINNLHMEDWFECFYTHQKQRKRKTYKDGFVCLRSYPGQIATRSIELYATCNEGNPRKDVIDSLSLSNQDPHAIEGEDFDLPGHLVTIGDKLAESPFLKRDAQATEESQAVEEGPNNLMMSRSNASVVQGNASRMVPSVTILGQKAPAALQSKQNFSLPSLISENKASTSPTETGGIIRPKKRRVGLARPISNIPQPSPTQRSSLHPQTVQSSDGSLIPDKHKDLDASRPNNFPRSSHTGPIVGHPTDDVLPALSRERLPFGTRGSIGEDPQRNSISHSTPSDFSQRLQSHPLPSSSRSSTLSISNDMRALLPDTTNHHAIGLDSTSGPSTYLSKRNATTDHGILQEKSDSGNTGASFHASNPLYQRLLSKIPGSQFFQSNPTTNPNGLSQSHGVGTLPPKHIPYNRDPPPSLPRNGMNTSKEWVKPISEATYPDFPATTEEATISANTFFDDNTTGHYVSTTPVKSIHTEEGLGSQVWEGEGDDAEGVSKLFDAVPYDSRSALRGGFASCDTTSDVAGALGCRDSRASSLLDAGTKSLVPELATENGLGEPMPCSININPRTDMDTSHKSDEASATENTDESNPWVLFQDLF